MTGFDLGAYLARIGLSRAEATADPDGLARVVRAQVGSIPFENLDVILGRPLPLEVPALAEKLVLRRRGGYCFELNGLLLAALAALGIAARPVLARVHLSGSPGPRTHMAILASFGAQDLLADAGFGGNGLRFPIPLAPGRVRVQEGDHFRLVDAGGLGLMLQGAGPEGWRDLWSFSPEPVSEADIAMSHFWTSRHPSSLFTRARVAALTLPEGRATLLDTRLTLRRGGEETVREVPPGPGYLSMLAETFGIDLGADAASLFRGPG